MALDRRTTLALCVIYIVWGANFVAVDIAVDDIAPAAMMGLRFLVAGLLLLPLSHLTRSPSTIELHRRWRDAAATAVPLFAGGSGLLAWGQTRISSGLAAVFISTMPIWLVGIAMARRELPPRASTAAAPIVGLAGVAVIANPNVTEPVDPAGCIIVLAAALSWALGSRRSRSGRTGNVLEQTAMQMTVGGTILCAIAAVTVAAGQPLGTLTVEAAAATSWLIVISSMLGFSAYTHALRHAPLTLVAAYPYANIAIAVGLGSLLLGEAITTSRLAGATIVVLATLLARTGTAEQHHDDRP